MKLRVIMEIEVSDLPKHAREELEDGLNFVSAEEHDEVNEGLDEDDSDYVPLVPKLSDCSAEEVQEAVVEAIVGVFSDYDSQAEMWAGTEFYGYISAVDIHRCQVIDEDGDAEPK